MKSNINNNLMKPPLPKKSEVRKASTTSNIEKLKFELFNNFKPIHPKNSKKKKPDNNNRGSFNIALFAHTNMVSKFITLLQSRARSYIFRRLSKHQLEIIDDQAANYDYYLDKKIILGKVTHSIWGFVNIDVLTYFQISI